jgi:NTE family protein
MTEPAADDAQGKTGHIPETVDPTSVTIGVCLSGGGFRASFYALGVLRYLDEAALMNSVVSVSSVSGGAIAAAAVADRWNDYQASATSQDDAFLTCIDQPFRDTVTTKNLRRRWILASLITFPGSGGRGGALARTLKHNLYKNKRVADLPAHPEIIFAATDLSKGRNFYIASAYTGSWDYGYIQPTPTSLKLGTAVAASAAFPPSLAIVNLRTKRLLFPESAPPPRLSLVDGGAYDNLGLEWFHGWTADARRPDTAVQPTFLIVVNASGILEEKNKRFRPISALKRELSIQYQQVLYLRIRARMQVFLETPGSGVYVGIKADPRDGAPAADVDGALPSELVRPLALLRTDLDRFSQEEANLLSYHAYWTLHARLRAHAPSFALADPSWREYGNLSPAEVERLVHLLEIGSHRFFRRVRRLWDRARL